MDLFRSDSDVRLPRGLQGTVRITLNCIARCIQHPETVLAEKCVSFVAVLANTTNVYVCSLSDSGFWRASQCQRCSSCQGSHRALLIVYLGLYIHLETFT